MRIPLFFTLLATMACMINCDIIQRMKNAQSGFVGALLLVIIAALLIGGGAYFYVHNKQANQSAIISQTTQATSTIPTTNQTTSTSSPVSTWQTYQNETIGITFQYPQGLNVSSTSTPSDIGPPGSGNVVSIIFPSSYYPTPYTIGYSFRIFSSGANDSDQCFNNDPGISSLTGKYTVINNLPWYKRVDDFCDVETCDNAIYYTAYQNNMCYTVRSWIANYQQNPSPTSEPIDEKILSTLKIIK